MRFHGSDNENYRICNTCVDAKSHERKRADGEDCGAGQERRPKQAKGKGGTRTRLNLDQKLEILKLLAKRLTHEQIADRFNCSVCTVRSVEADKVDVEKGLAQQARVA